IQRQLQPLRGRIAINLRNHRKLLIVDGRLAFTGGMNISARHLLEQPPRRQVLDYHTRVEGPAVAQLQRVFAEDWFDVTSEPVLDSAAFPAIEPAGTDVVRAIDSGPDRSIRAMLKAFCAAVQTASRSIRVVTPYFVPDPALVILLQLAAMGGVDTRIVLPRDNNFRTVKYAARHLYPELMRAGVRIFEREAPFSHAKLLLVDDTWASVGSANWDMRTFYLQFDTNIGVVSPAFVGQIAAAVEEEMAASTEIVRETFLPRPALRGILETAASLFADVL
ncbi:MAG: phospholipase D-like domain-containing protein, partial [Myxococcota bacterium]|nr:phospholipase D-like domain-containing protein [Myxococcota bacterium]